MRCGKCGVTQTYKNFNNRSCRVHNVIHTELCNCGGGGNCYHEWAYFWLFWRMIRLCKNFIKKTFERPPINSEETYVIL